jgi:hypothetical protein
VGTVVPGMALNIISVPSGVVLDTIVSRQDAQYYQQTEGCVYEFDRISSGRSILSADRGEGGGVLKHDRILTRRSILSADRGVLITIVS